MKKILLAALCIVALLAPAAAEARGKAASNRNAPVTLTFTSFPGQGVLGDLFCSLSGGPR